MEQEAEEMREVKTDPLTPKTKSSQADYYFEESASEASEETKQKLVVDFDEEIIASVLSKGEKERQAEAVRIKPAYSMPRSEFGNSEWGGELEDTAVLDVEELPSLPSLKYFRNPSERQRSVVKFLASDSSSGSEDVMAKSKKNSGKNNVQKKAKEEKNPKKRASLREKENKVHNFSSGEKEPQRKESSASAFSDSLFRAEGSGIDSEKCFSKKLRKT
jgi:hypothetical protein